MNFLDLDNIEFPSFDFTSEEGILAIGGDLSSKRLIHAYKNGIFPWYNPTEPIIWWAPNPRFVLFPKDLKVSKSMRSVFKKNLFSYTENNNFEAVIDNCGKVFRKGQNGTWLSSEMKDAYIKLYKLGVAKSIEVWNKDKKLVGGLYGIEVGNVFCGESMFALESNASKFGFISLVQQNKYSLIDCQWHSHHLESLGATFIPRNTFLEFLKV